MHKPSGYKCLKIGYNKEECRKEMRNKKMKAYVVVDIETTGTQPLHSDIIEIGAVYIENNKVVGKFSELVCPTQEISPYITGITGITNEMVQQARPIEAVLPAFIAFCKEAPLVGHNLIVFDYRMLKVKATRLNLPFQKSAVDTLLLARKFLKALPSRKLGDLCAYYGIDLTHAHRAYDDAYATYELYQHLEKSFKIEDPLAFEPEQLAWEMPKWVGITPKQQKFLSALCTKYDVTLNQAIDAYSKSEASKMIDKIISEYGRL